MSTAKTTNPIAYTQKKHEYKGAIENGDILQNNLDSFVSSGRNDASGPVFVLQYKSIWTSQSEAMQVYVLQKHLYAVI